MRGDDGVEITEARTFELVERCRRGDSEAESLLFHRFVRRLLRFLQATIPDGFTRRFESADVAQSVFASLFRAIREDRITIKRSGDLWAWLTTIASRKVAERIREQLALKRSLARETEWVTREDQGPEFPSREPGDHEALAIVEEIELLFGPVGSHLRRVVDMRLQDMTQEEIAERMGVSHTTVGRWLRTIAARLAARYRSFENEPKENTNHEPDDRCA